MNYQVYGRKIYVILEPVEGKQIGKIFVPDQHSERQRIATVQQVGHGVSFEPSDNVLTALWNKITKKRIVKPGDRVVVSFYSGTRLHLIGQELGGVVVEEETHRVITQDEIIMKVS